MPLKGKVRGFRSNTLFIVYSLFPTQNGSAQIAVPVASASSHDSHSPEMVMNPYPSRIVNPNEYFLLQVSLVVES